MELTGEKIIAAPRQRVYDALHDTMIIRKSVPGCQVLNRVADDRYEATIALNLGPLKSSFFGTIQVYNVDPPSGYSLRAEASGGLSGNASGDAHVALASVDATTTNLAYYIRAEMNGKLAELDRRQLDDAARALVAEFFSRLQESLETARFVATADPTTDATGAPHRSREPRLPAEDMADETAYSASHYTDAGEPPFRTGETSAPAQEFDTVGVPRLAIAPATTDALGEPLRAADAAASDTRIGAGYEPTPVAAIGRPESAPVQPQYGGRNRAATVVEPPRNGMTLWRWFLVLLGLAAIAALLTGMV